MGIKISVVIPTYKRPELLLNCLQAMLMQTLPVNEFEVIVISDGPDTISKAVVDSFINSNIHVDYYELPNKRGPAAARNAGWKSASANLIAFTDDDCRPDKNWLKNILFAYKGEIDIAYTGMVIVPILGRPTDFEKNTTHLQTASFITANCCCTRSALMLAGGFDERFSMAWREDSDLEFKLILNHIPIFKLNDAVVVHPVRKAPWGVSIKEQKKGMFNALLFKKFPYLYRQKIQSSPAWDYYAIVIFFIMMWIGIVYGLKYLAIVSLWGYIFLEVRFIVRRLANTSLALNHIAEMVITSFVIPFTSIYWQLYGAFKYRVLFL